MKVIVRTTQERRKRRLSTVTLIPKASPKN